MLPKNESPPLYGRGFGCLWWKPVFFACWLGVLFGLVSASACVPPLQLLCRPCAEGDTCGDDNPFLCKEGFCVYRDNPDPAPCRAENNEGGEQVEPTAEGNPEESTNPEESATPEDGAQSEEPYLETEPEKPDIPDTNNVLIAQIEGDDDQAQAVSYPSGTNPPADARPAKFRFRNAWRVYGANLQRIDTWLLQSKDKSQTFTLTAFDKKDNEMKLTLPAALTAGFFTLIGLIGTTPTVQADTFVLQGKDGAQGPKGDIGPKGDGFDPATLTFVNALKSAVTVNGNTLTFKAETITVDTKTFTVKGTKGASLQFDDDKQTITVDKANLQVTSGSGTTDGTVNGFGNIIIGYNENTSAKTRTGSHNLILGTEHGYTEYSSILSGTQHTINAPYASAIGGSSNIINANAPNAVAIAGQNNTFASSGTALYATAIAGQDNKINSNYAAAVAGQNNSNTGTHAAAVAGQNNSITASHAATLAGGGTNKATDQNTVSASYAAAIAGQNNQIQKKNASAVAGQDNVVNGDYAAAVSGQDNVVGGNYAAAVAGERNTPNGTHSATVAGGGATDALKNQTVVSHTAILGGQSNNINASSKAGVAMCGSFKVSANLNVSSCCVGTP